MNEIKLPRNARALAIVAHPDDETIWMGGTILKFKSVDWTILCLSRASDPDRSPKFMRVADHFGARGLIDDLDDEHNWSVKRFIPAVIKIISSRIGRSNRFDYIFTHGENGEYGHPCHIAVHQAVIELVKKRELDAGQTLFFNYRKISRREFSPLTMRAGSDYGLSLSRESFKAKKKIMSDIYGFAPDGIDASYCTNPEAYKAFK